jgi:cytochrome P450
VTTITDFDEIDYFRARPLYQDPYPFYEWLRSHGPVWREPYHDVVMVTGFAEAMSVYNDPKTFSSCNTVSGPFTKWPVPLEGDDISEIIEEHRDVLPFSDQLPSFDPPVHTEQRGLLLRLITPKRLGENEEFMWRLADQQIDEFHDRGTCQFVHDYANPFTLLVVADLLGVPEEDHAQFREELQGEDRGRRRMSENDGMVAHKPLEFLYDRFRAYIEERRSKPRPGVMTELATATFSDGSLPPIDDVMRIASNLFAAGQETTARMLSTGMQLLGERPDLQQRLRDDRSLIPAFVEECVRIESPLQGQFRLARVATKVGDMEIPPGTNVFVMPGAANRDPRQFEDPAEFRLDRANGRHHLGFGFGIHTCVGAPLARAEGKVSFERLLDRMGDIRISEAEHGPPGDRRYEYTPVYLMRGLEALHLEFTPIDAPQRTNR